VEGNEKVLCTVACLVSVSQSPSVVDARPVELARELIAPDAIVVGGYGPGRVWNSLVGTPLGLSDIHVDVG